MTRREPRFGREIVSVRGALRSLDHSLRRLASMLGQLDGRIERRRRPRAGTRKLLSPKARASMVLQGRYMGYMRQLKPRQKAQVRKVKQAKGVRAAIARAREMARA